MLFTEKKLQNRLEELKNYRWKNIEVINEFLMREDEEGVSNPVVPELGETDEKFVLGDTWKGRNTYRWLQKKIKLLKEDEYDSTTWEQMLAFDFCGPGCEFEGMIYIDGEPYQGIDAYHHEVFLRREDLGAEHTITLRLWSGIERGGVPKELTHEFRDARLSLLHTPTDVLYYMGTTILSTVNLLREDQEERTDMLTALDEAFMFVDWTDKGSDNFFESTAIAEQYLASKINELEKNTKVKVSCVGHTHIDTAWLWQLKHTREKVSRSFSTVLRMMERYPEYLFMHTQPQQYAYLKEDFPQIYEQIKKRVEEGRWEIDGATWVEPDCNIPSGESLTRQFLIGRKFMVEEFGKEPTFLWLPDVFGYSAAMPQIMKKSGINSFMTVKLTWNQYNRIPNDTFWWEGIDGTKVLTHLLTTPNPYVYNGVIKPDLVSQAWTRYRDKRLNKDILFTYGYGDGGGGPSRKMFERRRIMDKLPGLPNVKMSSAGDYFKQLHETVENTTQPMATWDGELYLEYHRGTYTSQAYCKKMNRYLENLYRKAEWLTTMAALRQADLSYAEQEKLTEGWKILLTHQFHDIIPGTSIHEVYEDAMLNYQRAKEIADEVIGNAYAFTDNKEGFYTIFNATAEKRSGMVRIAEECDLDKYGDKTICTDNGEKVLTQVGADGVWAYVEDVPAMGVKQLQVCGIKDADEEECATIAMNGNTMRLTTPFYQIDLNDKGQISYLYDIENDMQVLEEGACGNVLQLFEDKPLDYDAWDIDIFYYQKKQEISNLCRREIIENGSLRTVIRQEWNFGKSTITQDMILYTMDARIDFKTHVNWQETQKLLKVAFPVDIRTTYATYDIQYGNLRRPNNSNTSWERAKFEVVAHRFADLSEHEYGVSLLNDCKYGYDVHQNVMRLSLLKSPIYPDYSADKGEHSFTYALYPHKGDFICGKTVQAAIELNQPMEALPGKIDVVPNNNGSTVTLTGAYVEIDAFKKSEDGKSIVLRFHEYSGSKGKVKMNFGFPVKRICECDLMERPLEEFHEDVEYKTSIRAYEIKTFLLEV